MLYGIAEHAIDPHLNRAALERALRFLVGEAAALPDGRHELGEGIYVAIKRYRPGPAADKRFETHVEHADIQYVIEGGETIYTAPLSGLAVTEDLLATDDVRFHAEPPAGSALEFHLRPGSFLLLLPEDAHKPECFCGFSEGRKAIAKIPMALLFDPSGRE